MTFPLGSLRAEGAASGNTYTRKSAAKSGLPVAVPAAPAARWRQQAWVIVGAVAWLLLLLALATHHLGDPGFSTSGDGESLRNKAGMVGAWVSDLGLFLFGYSVWWFIPVGCAPGCPAWQRPFAARTTPHWQHHCCRVPPSGPASRC